MAWFIFSLLLLGLLVTGSYYRLARRRAVPRPEPAASDPVSFAAPVFEWSGTANGVLTLKTLTYKQYECLEDARYGFKIVGRSPSERKLPQPHKTRAHGQKTVASLAKHGFLVEDGEGAYLIADHGLNALEVCSVRY